MKNYIPFISVIVFCQFCQSQIVNIPDVNFKNALVNSSCVDTNGDHFGDSDADTNDDGEIQVSEAEAVFGLHINGRDIVSPEGIQSFVNLLELQCSDNDFNSIDISNSPKLEILECGYTPLTTVDVTQNPLLYDLAIYNTQITAIDVSQNPNISDLFLRDNPLLTSLDVSQNLNLIELNCERCDLSSIDLSQNPILEETYLEGNDLVSLDISTNPNVFRITCNDNEPLTELNLKNGNSNGIIRMMAMNNPNLNCIEVDDVIYANNQPCNAGNDGNWCKDETTIYSEDCSLGYGEFESVFQGIFPNPAMDSFSVLSLEPIEKVQIFSADGRLVCTVDNKFDAIDISQFTSGVFLVTIHSGAANKSYRLVKM